MKKQENSLKFLKSLQENGVYSINSIIEWLKKYTNQFNELKSKQKCEGFRVCEFNADNFCSCGHSFNDLRFLEIYEKTSELAKFGCREEYCFQELETYSKIKENEIELKKWVVKNELIGADEFYEWSYEYSESIADGIKPTDMRVNLNFSPGSEFYVDINGFKNAIKFSVIFYDLFWNKEIYPESEILKRIEKEMGECEPPEGKIEVKFNNMNKEEAIAALAEGKRMVHKSFTELQWIKSYKENKTHYMWQDGSVVQATAFWGYRKGEEWGDGWSIQEPNIGGFGAHKF